ncbi:hypothetical protein EZS27_001503 [termite gut metagenome]|uniref:Uncharacterized protein n=1 Tax=termite gut metagenome TaxID=433724 RepID=A0A5J4SYJ0_9ZZZZ
MGTQISFLDMFVYTAFMGVIILPISSIVFTLLCVYTKQRKSIIKMVSLILVQLLFSMLLSTFIWYILGPNRDIMIGFISIPLLCSEIVTIPLFYLIWKKLIK